MEENLQMTGTEVRTVILSAATLRPAEVGETFQAWLTAW
jgi:precorrin-6B methylase 2